MNPKHPLQPSLRIDRAIVEALAFAKTGYRSGEVLQPLPREEGRERTAGQRRSYDKLCGTDRSANAPHNDRSAGPAAIAVLAAPNPATDYRQSTKENSRI
jgi:hypothetical protein